MSQITTDVLPRGGVLQTIKRCEDRVTREAFELAKTASDDAARLYRSPQKIAVEARKQLTRQFKLASFGFNQNPQFERAFGAIAFTYLQEKAPGLLPYTVGFQLLDRSPEGDRSFGAFVAKIGDQVIDIPMVYRNGELTGHHVMHLRRSDLFLPLREAFIDYLFSKSPQDLGETGPPLNAGSPVRGTPDLRPFDGSRYAKGASEIPHVRPWAIDYDLPAAYASMVLNPANLKLAVALKNNTPGVHLDLLPFVAASRDTLRTTARLCDAYPAFNQKMAAVCGKDWLRRACDMLPRQAKVASSLSPGIRLGQRVVTPKPDTRELYKLSAEQARQAVGTQKTAGLRAPTDSSKQLAMLTEVQRYGDYIEDRRPTDKLAKLYEIQAGEVSTVHPCEIDTYKVVVDSDSSAKRLIIPHSHRYSCRSGFDLVIDMSSKRWCVARPSHYIAVESGEDRGKDPNKSSKDVFKATRPSKNDVFVVTTKNGTVYGPLLLMEKHQGHWTVDDVSDEFVHDDWEHRPTVDPPCTSRSPVRKIYITSGKNASKEGMTGEYLTIAKDSKFLVLGDAPDGYMWEAREKMQDTLLPASKIDMPNFHKYANLHVTVSQGSRVKVGSQTVSRGEARRFLVGNVGLSKTAAHEILENPGLKRSFVVVPADKKPTYGTIAKLAYNDYTPDFPQFQEPSPSDSGYYNMESPEQHQTSGPLETPRQPLDNTYVPQGERDVMMSGQEQAAMGSPAGDDLFDMIGLVALLRNGRLDSTVRETSQALLQAVNRLGRQILVFEVHDDDFRDRYGEANAENVKAALLSTFESVGDFFITLIRQSDTPDPELDVAQLPG